MWGKCALNGNASGMSSWITRKKEPKILNRWARTRTRMRTGGGACRIRGHGRRHCHGGDDDFVVREGVRGVGWGDRTHVIGGDAAKIGTTITTPMRETHKAGKGASLAAALQRGARMMAVVVCLAACVSRRGPPPAGEDHAAARRATNATISRVTQDNDDDVIVHQR
jgi:hypothetical protein